MKLYRFSSAAIACVVLLSACQPGGEADEENEEEVAPVR